MLPLRWFIAVAVVLAATCVAAPAQAKSQRDASYPYERVWPAAVRFLRVDQSVEILEKDGDVGYVLFKIEDDRKQFRGALELIRIKDHSGRAAVRLVLRIDDRPSYVESLLLKKLMRKLVAELGHPVRLPRKKKPTKPTPAKPGTGDKPDDSAKSEPATESNG